MLQKNAGTNRADSKFLNSSISFIFQVIFSDNEMLICSYYWVRRPPNSEVFTPGLHYSNLLNTAREATQVPYLSTSQVTQTASRNFLRTLAKCLIFRLLEVAQEKLLESFFRVSTGTRIDWILLRATKVCELNVRK